MIVTGDASRACYGHKHLIQLDDQLGTSTMVSTGSAPPRTRISRTG
jgi:hypothetical protein